MINQGILRFEVYKKRGRLENKIDEFRVDAKTRYVDGKREQSENRIEGKMG